MAKYIKKAAQTHSVNWCFKIMLVFYLYSTNVQSILYKADKCTETRFKPQRREEENQSKK